MATGFSTETMSYTSAVYGHIRNQEYRQALSILETQVQRFPRSRAALSLLGYCYYHDQDYMRAADTYGKLIHVCPNIEEYHTHRIQSLLKAGALSEASHFMSNLPYKHVYPNNKNQHCSQRLLMIQFCTKLEEEDIQACRSILQNCIQDDPETLCAVATIDFKEGRFEEALERYIEAFNMTGFIPTLAYNIALCNFMLKHMDEAVEMIDEIIARGIDKHPEFSPKNTHGSCTVPNNHVDNSVALQDTYLIEAYNLKAAIEYNHRKVNEARETLRQMPPRKEQDLDAVTLHNVAILDIHSNNTGLSSDSDSFQKLSFLLENPPFPPVTFRNLLILYCQYGYHDVAADILAENSHLTFDLLDQDTYEYLDASIMIPATPNEAVKKFEVLVKKYVASIRTLKKELDQMKDHVSSVGGVDVGVVETVEIMEMELEDKMNRFIPALMAQASIYWDREDYVMVEQLLRQNNDICEDNEKWKLNMAHSLFVQQESKFKDCIEYYEPVMSEHGQKSLLDVSPIVLANLCVAYIMSNRNEEAEEIMKRAEKQEESTKKRGGGKKDKQNKIQEKDVHHHNCIINLVIGTLYCEKGNYDFGISRICKSLEPLECKLDADTWHYAKRCLVALADRVAKQMTYLKVDVAEMVLQFLDDVSQYGRSIPSYRQSETGVGVSVDDGSVLDHSTEDRRQEKSCSISFEALKLKSLFLQLIN